MFDTIELSYSPSKATFHRFKQLTNNNEFEQVGINKRRYIGTSLYITYFDSSIHVKFSFHKLVAYCINNLISESQKRTGTSIFDELHTPCEWNHTDLPHTILPFLFKAFEKGTTLHKLFTMQRNAKVIRADFALCFQLPSYPSLLNCPMHLDERKGNYLGTWYFNADEFSSKNNTSVLMHKGNELKQKTGISDANTAHLFRYEIRYAKQRLFDEVGTYTLKELLSKSVYRKMLNLLENELNGLRIIPFAVNRNNIKQTGQIRSYLLHPETYFHDLNAKTGANRHQFQKYWFEQFAKVAPKIDSERNIRNAILSQVKAKRSLLLTDHLQEWEFQT